MQEEKKIDTSFKGIPEKLYKNIQRIAKREKRSINVEMLILIEKAVKMVEEGKSD